MDKLEHVLFYHGDSPSELPEKILDRLEQYFGKYCRFSNIDYELFSDGEPDNRIPRYSKIEGKTVVFIQSFFKQKLFFDALEFSWAFKKQYKASRLVMVILFMMYRRQDHPEKLEEICRLKMAIEQLKNAGVDEIITVSPHSKKMQEFCQEVGIKMQEVNPLPIFASTVKTYLDPEDNCITCAPDEGATGKAREMAKLLGCPMVFGLKERGFDNEARLSKKDQKRIDQIITQNKELYDFDNIAYATKENVEGKTAIVIEDEASTCTTSTKFGYHLKNLGATKTILVAANAVLTPGWRRKLFPEENPPYFKVIMGDSIPRGYNKKTGGKIHDDSVAWPIADVLYKSLKT